MSRLLVPFAMLLAASAAAQYSAGTLSRWRVANQGASNKRVLVSPDGNLVALVSSQNAVSVWQTGTRAKLFDLHSESFGVAFSPDSRLIALGTGTSVSLYDAQTGWLRWKCATGVDAVRSVAFARDGASVLFAGLKGRIGMVGATGRVVYLGRVGTADLSVSALSANGDVYAVGGTDGKVTLVKAASGQALSTGRTGLLSAATGLAFSPDGKYLYGSELNGKVRRWSAGDDATNGTLVYSGVEVKGIAADNANIAVAAGTAGAVLVDATTLGQRSIPLPAWTAENVALDRGDVWVAGNRSFVSRHGVADLVPQGILGPRPSGTSPVAWSADGRVLTSGDKSILSMGANDGALSYGYRSEGSFYAIARSAGDGYEAYGSVNDFVALRKLSTNTVTKHKVSGMGNPYAIAFAPRLGAEADSPWFAVACGDKLVRMWNLDGGLLKTLDGPTSVPRSIAVSPDRARIAAGDDGGRVVVFRLSDGQVERILGPYGSAVKNVRYAPSGELVIGVGSRVLVVGASTREITFPTGVTVGDVDVFGNVVAVGTSNKVLSLYTLAGDLLATVGDLISTPNRVAFSPSGDRIALQLGTTNVQVLANPLTSRLAWIAPYAFGVESGSSTWLGVQLSAPAPAGGAVVSLTADNANLKAPASVFFAGGESYGEVWIAAQPGSGGTANLRAQFNGSAHGVSLDLLAPTIESIALDTASVKGGGKVNARVRLSGIAPTAGVTVSLTVSAGATVPATVSVPAGAREATFQISTTGTANPLVCRLTASHGPVRRQATIQITP